jgi:hypothetical protein
MTLEEVQAAQEQLQHEGRLPTVKAIGRRHQARIDALRAGQAS